MAEAVHAILEEMIPELNDLSECGIFSANEIKAIVKKRTDFEYSLHKRTKQKSDFLKSIQYELNLNALREERKGRLHIKRNTPSDFFMIRRLHFIFVRMLTKFKEDKTLWLQYFDFCHQAKSWSLLKKAYAKALSFHPYETTFWIEAAKFEFETNSNIKAARVLLQRSLRLNKKSKELWIEYFRLEMLFIEKIRLRRKILFDEENKVSEFKDESVDSKDPINYTVPDIVYQTAIEEIPNDVEFRICFADVYSLFPDTQKIVQAIYDGLLNDPKLEEKEIVYELLANRNVSKEGLNPESLQKACEMYDTAIDTVATSLMGDYYLTFLSNAVEKNKEENELNSSLITKIISVTEILALKQILSVKSFENFSSIMLTYHQSSEFLRIFMLTKKSMDRIIEFWLISINFSLKSLPNEEVPLSIIMEMFDQSFLLHPNSSRLWILHIQFMQDNFPSDMEMVFTKSLKVVRHLESKAAIQNLYLDWILPNKDISVYREFYRTFIQELPSSLLKELLIKCICAEKAQPTISTKNVIFLYEKLILTEVHSIEFYIQYIQFLRQENEFGKATIIFERMKRNLGCDDSFEENVSNIINQI